MPFIVPIGAEISLILNDFISVNESPFLSLDLIAISTVLPVPGFKL